jgi:hypothetical protein
MQYYEGQAWKTPPHCKYHLFQISLLALHMLAGIVLLAYITPKASHQTTTWYSMIHLPKSHILNCPLSSGIALYTTSGGKQSSHAKYLVYGQLLAHGTPFLLTLDAQSWCWLDNCSTVELTGDCFTRYLASFTSYLLQRSTTPVGH